MSDRVMDRFSSNRPPSSAGDPAATIRRPDVRATAILAFFATLVLMQGLGPARKLADRYLPAEKSASLERRASIDRSPTPDAGLREEPIGGPPQSPPPPALPGSGEDSAPEGGERPDPPVERQGKSLDPAGRGPRSGLQPRDSSGLRPRGDGDDAERAPVDGEGIYRMVFPVVGDCLLTDSFGDPRPGKRNHKGEDIMAEKGTPVVAVADGRVVWMRAEVGGKCCALSVRHDDGWLSRYIHLNNDTPGTDDGLGYGIADGIRRGSRVRAGTLLGWVGDSGNAEVTAPHLHFELEPPEGSAIDPHPSLEAASLVMIEKGYEIRQTR